MDIEQLKKYLQDEQELARENLCNDEFFHGYYHAMTTVLKLIEELSK